MSGRDETPVMLTQEEISYMIDMLEGEIRNEMKTDPSTDLVDMLEGMRDKLKSISLFHRK